MSPRAAPAHARGRQLTRARMPCLSRRFVDKTESQAFFSAMVDGGLMREASASQVENKEEM